MERAVFILGSLLVFTLPLATWGDDKPNYISAGTGFYFYLGDVGEKTNLDEAFIGEIAYGRSFHPNFALEGRIGYIHDGHRSDELQGYPLTLTAIGIYPLENVNLFAGGGVGVYFMNFDGEVNNVNVHGKDTAFGGHLLMGANLNVWSPVFVGIEGKYLFVEQAQFDGQEVDLDGFTVTAKFGFRF